MQKYNYGYIEHTSTHLVQHEKVQRLCATKRTLVSAKSNACFVFVHQVWSVT